jgi:hypothetical protein
MTLWNESDLPSKITISLGRPTSPSASVGRFNCCCHHHSAFVLALPTSPCSRAAPDRNRLLQLPGPELSQLGRAVWNVSSSDLNKAYRKLSLLVHPDKAPGPEARQAFEQLKEAYNELRDSDKLVSDHGVLCAGLIVTAACITTESDRQVPCRQVLPAATSSVLSLKRQLYSSTPVIHSECYSSASTNPAPTVSGSKA